jgi:hypothetical protein
LHAFTCSKCATREIEALRLKYRRTDLCEEDAMSDTLVEDDLVLAVESLGDAHDRHEAERSDPTGTSAGDDGENRDSSP